MGQRREMKRGRCILIYFQFYLLHSEILKLMWRERERERKESRSLARFLVHAAHYQLSARVPNICIVSLRPQSANYRRVKNSFGAARNESEIDGESEKRRVACFLWGRNR
jgi:hypothetical protein